MKVNIQKTKNRFISILGAVVVLVSSLFVPVSATDTNGNEFLDINDYAKYSFSADNNEVNASLKFSSDWVKTFVFWDYVGKDFGAPDLSLTGNTINIGNASLDYYFSLIMYPFGKSFSVGSGVVGQTLQNSKILDLRYLPDGTSFSYSFDVKLSNPRTSVESYEGVLTEYLLYVDINGKVIHREVAYYHDPLNYEENGCRVIKWGGLLEVESVDGAVGFIPFFSLRNIACDWDSDIFINYSGLEVHFSMNSLEYDTMLDERLMSTMRNVQDQLSDLDKKFDSMISGTPEQNEQVDNAVGDLNDKADDLGALGDQMASVEKPEINSADFSAEKLVPKTSLTVLSAPFHALWENNTLLAMLSIVVALVLVSWIFFGKKG